MFGWLKKRPAIDSTPPADQEQHLKESQARLARALQQQAEVTELTASLADRNRDHYIERLERTYGRPFAP